MKWLIIVAIVLFFLLRSNKKTETTNSNTSASSQAAAQATRSTPPPSSRQAIALRGSKAWIASFADGVVYLKDTNTVLGRYDFSSEQYYHHGIYNKDGTTIGRFLSMDRQFILEQLRAKLPKDNPIHKDYYLPEMGKGAGDFRQKWNETYWVGWIEAPEGCDSVNIIGYKGDLVTRQGAEAAYILAIYHGLINPKLREFYSPDNLLRECYDKVNRVD